MSKELLQLSIVFAAIAADYITGLVKALYKHEYKSCVMREGLYHKAAELFAVVVMYYMEYGLPMAGITIAFPFVSVMTGYIIIMELSSIIENIGEINPDLIGPLAEIFEKVREVKDKKEGDKK